MKTNFYLKVNSKGSVSITKGAPYVAKDEVSIYVGVILPDVLFKQPQISATITVNGDDVVPFVINAETLNNVKDAIEQSTAMEVSIKLESPEPPKED